MKRMKSILHGYTSEDSVKMSVYQTPTGDAAIMQPVLSAILKFTDSKSADKALTVSLFLRNIYLYNVLRNLKKWTNLGR